MSASAELAAEIAHLLGVWGIGAVLALACVRVQSTVIAVASTKRFITPYIAARAIRLRRIPEFDCASFASAIEDLLNRIAIVMVAVRRHPVINSHSSELEGLRHLPRILASKLDRISIELSAATKHVGLVVIGVGDERTFMTSLALSARKYIGAEKGPR
jgi:hypothetical protein